MGSVFLVYIDFPLSHNHYTFSSKAPYTFLLHKVGSNKDKYTIYFSSFVHCTSASMLQVYMVI